MKLIVGLGNPGLKYKKTRHNVGFMFVDEVLKRLKEKSALDKGLKAEVANVSYRNEKLIFAKPQTFMNLSGEAVSAVAHFYKIDPEDILVVFDDLDLPEGKIRIRKNGSSGGHKGMNSIIQCLGTDQIKRIRLGIGHEDGIDAADYVLGKFSPEGKEIMKPIIEDALKMLDDYLSMPFEDFMSRYN
jgi:PTH1 family peptidyl-tRNA hydrolase